MLLYDMKTAMNPRRVRIFLAEKGIELPMQQVDGTTQQNRSSEFLAMNSLGKLPVLVLDDGTCISESIAICRYLEAIYPQSPLFGRDPLEQAKVEMWIRRIESEIVQPITSVFKHTGSYWHGRYDQVPAFGQWWAARAQESLEWLETELGEKSFLATDHYTMADIVLQCALIVGRATGTPIPASCPQLTRWYAEVTSRPTARA
jgi:glutathione S-transferase